VVTERLRQLADRLAAGFDAYESAEGPLPGFSPPRRASLIWQLVDSSRVSMYVEHLRTASLSLQAANASDAWWFNPILDNLPAHSFRQESPSRVAVRTRGVWRSWHGGTMELAASVC
jgi:hypothetical protein